MMQRTDPSLGIVSYGIYLPEQQVLAEALASNAGIPASEVKNTYGVMSKRIPSPQDQPVTMGVKAAADALEKSEGLGAEDVDVVIWVGEEHKDYPAQTASIRLQEEVGAKNAWAFDLIGQGVTSLLGIRVARSLFASDPSVTTVLLAGGTRNIDLVDESNRNTRWMLPTSASGGAMVLRRGHDKNQVKGLSTIVDPHLADEVFVPGGGTVHPYSEENLGTDKMFFQVAHPKMVEAYLEEEFPQKIAETVRGALEEAGTERADYLALRHLTPSQRSLVLHSLGLGPDCSETLEDLGHHGPMDVLLSLDRGLAAGTIKEGSEVVLASAGIGFNYAAAAVTWGSAR